LLARAVHALSGRSGPFIGVNCGAIPDTLVESEFFGHNKGAFSGAVSDQKGLIRSADGGTLFLDEIGDLAPASQSKLLRVLQEREVRPVGAAKSIPVDVRVISATHQDLASKIKSGEFRDDLFSRISGFTVSLPALCERREDLGLLIGELLKRLVPDSADLVRFNIEAGRHLFDYAWPRNIRELENCLATATVLAGEAPIGVEHLPKSITAPTADASGAQESQSRPLTSEQQEHRSELKELLRTHNGNVSAVARAVGKDRKQVRRWIKRYDLLPAEFLNDE
jgi:transcriptional regulator with GAF, ATPase, and Fis domain